MAKLTPEEKQKRAEERIAKEKREKEIEVYAEKLINNDEPIIKEINDAFEAAKPSITREIVEYIKDIFHCDVFHYEWIRGDIPWDNSGEIVRKGILTTEVLLEDFLEEYTGSWEATFEHGSGKRYRTYSDELSEVTLDMEGKILSNVLGRYVPADYSDDDRFFLADHIHDHFYENTVAYDFFFIEGVLDYLGKELIDPEKSVETLIRKYA